MYSYKIDRILAMLLWKLSMLEAHESKVWGQFLKPGMTVLDIGANIGFHTLQFASKVGSTGKVIAFEPSPDESEMLRKNIDANKYTNIVVENLAVSDSSGDIKLYINKAHHGDHRIFDGHDGREYINIKSIKLDEYPIDTVDFVKMDIQGAEGLALAGMTSLIGRSPNIVIALEFTPDLIAKTGFNESDFIDKIYTLGLKTFILDIGTGDLIESDADGICKYCKKAGYVNLILEKS